MPRILFSPAGFGKLVVHADGQTAQIEKDHDGWHGSSDLQICLYVSTDVLCEFTRTAVISLNLNPSAKNIFRSDYGAELEIFKSKLLDETHVHLLRAIPGYAEPNPTEISFSDDTHTSDRVTLSQPKFNVKGGEALLTRRITFLTDNDRQVLKVSEIATNPASPCTITITFGSIKHVCQFPHPIDGRRLKVSVARKSGWIELSVPLTVPKHPIGGYSSAILPLTRDVESNSMWCSWNLPLINFNQLKRVDDSDSEKLGWLEEHLIQTLSDREIALPQNLDSHPLAAFKLSMSVFFKVVSGIGGKKERVFGFSNQREMQVLLFVTGLYMDCSSHSVVAEAYCFEVTPEHRESRARRPPGEKLDLFALEQNLEYGHENE
jgi:hypothetical protein